MFIRVISVLGGRIREETFLPSFFTYSFLLSPGTKPASAVECNKWHAMPLLCSLSRKVQPRVQLASRDAPLEDRMTPDWFMTVWFRQFILDFQVRNSHSGWGRDGCINLIKKITLRVWLHNNNNKKISFKTCKIASLKYKTLFKSILKALTQLLLPEEPHCSAAEGRRTASLFMSVCTLSAFHETLILFGSS